MSRAKPFIVAAAQISPVFMDRSATIAKACDTLAEAAKNGAKLVVFPEAFVPSYPDWVWVTPAMRADLHSSMYAEMLDQAVTLPGPDLDELCRAARKHKCYVVIGVNERNAVASGTSLYNTLVYIDDRGKIMGVHRKLVPTAAERLVWTPGDGSTLEVFETPYGKLGGLICWENYMPLARYAMYALGTQIYVAATWDSSDSWVATLRHIAKEGRLYVIGCCIAMRRDEIPDSYGFKSLYPPNGEWVNVGNSAIVGPGGDLLAGPVASKEEILYAEIDSSRLLGSRYWLDAAGHYARPDVFQLTVNRRANPMIADAPEPQAD
ncbi:MAG TPA: carbon-nitrogen hydrolase family protein [Dehalococcoidia bacterium]